MKLLALKLSFLFIPIMLISCATNRNLTPQNTEVDGIIYFEKDEPGIKKKSKKRAKQNDSKSLNKKEQADSDNIRDFKKNDRIIYFDTDEQANEEPGKPLNLKHSIERGKASYYGDEFDGRKTASGEIYDQNKLTAAHPTLKFGTVVKVTNFFNDKSVIVRINDRGPYAKNRIIDLSKAAAKKLDMIKAGVIEVLIEVIDEQ